MGINGCTASHLARKGFNAYNYNTLTLYKSIQTFAKSETNCYTNTVGQYTVLKKNEPKKETS